MDLIKRVIFFFLIFVFISCSSGYKAHKEIKSMFPREDTGIVKLIRVDGYYYESSEEVYYPIVFTKNGEVKRCFCRFKSKIDLKDGIEELKLSTGYYKTFDDSIKVEWSFKIDLWSYRIYREEFLVLNDTTLQRIHFSIEGEEMISVRGSDIYKFQSFDISGLK